MTGQVGMVALFLIYVGLSEILFAAHTKTSASPAVKFRRHLTAEDAEDTEDYAEMAKPRSKQDRGTPKGFSLDFFPRWNRVEQSPCRDNLMARSLLGRLSFQRMANVV